MSYCQKSDSIDIFSQKSADLNDVSHLISFTDMPLRGEFKETALQVSYEWPYVMHISWYGKYVSWPFLSNRIDRSKQICLILNFSAFIVT